MTMRDTEDDLRVAHQLADIARSVILPYFRTSSLQTNNKFLNNADFDPVTQADKQAEQAMRRALATQRPDDAIFGEEYGHTFGTSGYTWVLDPIDGTRAFICGSPTWGVLIALNAGGKPYLGILDQPFSGERFTGLTQTSDASQPCFSQWSRGETPEHNLRVRTSCETLSDAVLMTTFPEIGTSQEAAAFNKIRDQVKLTRYGLDCYAYGLLAMGHIDLVIEAGLNAYDIQALVPVVEGAGGIITNWQGGSCYNGGQVIAAGSKKLYTQALDMLYTHMPPSQD